MTSLRPWMTLALLCAVATAGCLGSDDPSDPGTPQDTTDPDPADGGTEDDPDPTTPPDDPDDGGPPAPFREFLGVRQGDWFFAEPTGNCCENYVTVTPTGRVLDFGGTYIQYSDDAGKTWTTMDDTLLPYLNGEGAIAVAPGGDVVGIGWDPYAGDQVYSFRYDVETDTWDSAIVPIHTPAWDRQWIIPLAGPFTINDEEVPYVVLARGGSGYKDAILLSTDGLNYDLVSLPDAETLANSETVLPALDAPTDEWRDWTQPLREATISSVGPGMGIQKFGTTTYLFDSEGQWSTLRLSEGTIPEGPMVMDSAGTLHVVQIHDDEDSFSYIVSHDGGRSWSNGTWDLPEGLTVYDWDFKAHAAQDQTVVAIRADAGEGRGQDLVYRFHDLDGDPWLLEVLLAGDGEGDLGGGGASNTDSERYDFMSTAFMPGGRIVFSTMDSTTPDPVLAFEL